MTFADGAISRLARGIGLALLAADMMIHGFVPPSDVVPQTDTNGAFPQQDGQESGDFLALLFLTLTASAAPSALQAGAGESSPSPVSSPIHSAEVSAPTAIPDTSSVLTGNIASSESAGIPAEGARQLQETADNGMMPSELSFRGNTGMLNAPSTSTRILVATAATDEESVLAPEIPLRVAQNASLDSTMLGSDTQHSEVATKHSVPVSRSQDPGQAPTSNVARDAGLSARVPREYWTQSRNARGGENVHGKWDHTEAAMSDELYSGILMAAPPARNAVDGGIDSPQLAFDLRAEPSESPLEPRILMNLDNKTDAIAAESAPRQSRQLGLGYVTYAREQSGPGPEVFVRQPPTHHETGMADGLGFNERNVTAGAAAYADELRFSEISFQQRSSAESSTQQFLQVRQPKVLDEALLPPSEVQQEDMPLPSMRLTDHALTQKSEEPKPVQWRPMVSHIVDHIQGQIRIGRQEAVMRLDPPELGSLKIDLHLQGDKLEARIIAETRESQTLIEAHLPELRQALGENKVELINVRIESGTWGSTSENGQQGTWREAGSGQPSENDIDGDLPDSFEERERGAHHPVMRAPGRLSRWA